MNKALCILTLIALTFSLSITHASTPSATVVAPSAPAAQAARPGATPDEATEMRHAQHALENAQNDLLHVAHEYGGHRVKATQAITAALQELKQAQQQPNNK